MPTTPDLESLERRRDELRMQLATIGDLRPGSLVARYRKCGKPNCHCANEQEGGHGPSWSLTKQAGGKTVTRVIQPDAVARTKEHIAECKRLRQLTAELIEVSDQICQAQLTAAARGEAAKKGASKRPSTRKSSPRSKPS